MPDGAGGEGGVAAPEGAALDLSGGEARWVLAEDGVRLRVVHWEGGARGTVLIFTGRTEYAEKYAPVAADLVARGYSAATLDWRGQGLSGRLRSDRWLGHVGRFLDYQRDVTALVRHVDALGLPRPHFLLSHSMGGCIGLRAMIDGLDVQAAAFTAPMWGIQMKPALRPVAWSLSSMSRSVGLGHLLTPGQVPESYILRAAFEANTLTSDEGSFARMQQHLRAAPDLALGGPSLHWLHEALREMRRLAREPSPPIPSLVLLGSEERIVDPLRIRRRMERWPEAEFRVIEGSRHEVLMEAPAIRDRALDAVDALFSSSAR